jgi:hypothetical protein
LYDARAARFDSPHRGNFPNRRPFATIGALEEASVGEYWQLMFQRVREKCLPLQHLAPLAGSGLVVAAGFCSSRALRLVCLALAIILFLFVTADFARSLLDKEPADASEQQPAKDNPVSTPQVFLTFILAAVYFGIIFSGLYTLFISSRLVLFVMTPAVVVFSGLAAWRNVRLWYRQGENYEEALKEETALLQKLRVPPVR